MEKLRTLEESRVFEFLRDPDVVMEALEVYETILMLEEKGCISAPKGWSDKGRRDVIMRLMMNARRVVVALMAKEAAEGTTPAQEKPLNIALLEYEEDGKAAG